MLEWMDIWDGVALVWFFIVWCSYTAYADHGPAHARSITAAMNARRRAWMLEAAKRDLRMIDTNILGNLLTGVGFFSSTTIFVIGGLIAMIGVAEKSALALARLPLIDAAQPAALEIKTVGLLVIFIYAFFKFAWAFRLANYCSITVGGLARWCRGEERAQPSDCRGGRHIVRTVGAPLQSRLRAYFFALAGLGWLIGPAVFVLLTTGVAAVIYRREFRSRALLALRELNSRSN